MLPFVPSIIEQLSNDLIVTIESANRYLVRGLHRRFVLPLGAVSLFGEPLSKMPARRIFGDYGGPTELLLNSSGQFGGRLRFTVD